MEVMSKDARQIANWFIKRAKTENQTLTIMSLLKLCFLSQEKYLEKFNQPLFENKIEIWNFGPVIPDVYESLRLQGIRPTEPIYGYPANVSRKEIEFLEEIYKRYSVKQPSKLEIRNSGPWVVTKKKPVQHTFLQSSLAKKLLKSVFLQNKPEDENEQITRKRRA